MSEADKMFEELGYDKCELEIFIDYLSRENSHVITFRKDMKVVNSSCGIGSEYITMQELKAIQTKCKELGWI